MSCGTMELQPPWANELLARNRKVARNIWSTSDLAELEHVVQTEKTVPSWTTGSANGSKIEDTTEVAASTKNIRIIGGGGGGYGSDNVENVKSIDPVIGSSRGNSRRDASATDGSLGLTLPLQQQTDKSGLMTQQQNTSNASSKKQLQVLRHSNSNNSTSSDIYYDARSASFEDTIDGDESLLEYGPGIVRKLRSKYQSLAVRQTSSRPSLWRSASLENCLDLDQTPEQEGHPLSPSPTPKMTQNIIGSDDNDSTTATRGRTVATKAEMLKANNNNNSTMKSDRMRRARSVDALHNIVNSPTMVENSRSSRRRQQQQQYDEEILEKCKTVVTPKEEIVIIEVSKPNIISTTGAALLRLTTSSTTDDKRKLLQLHKANGKTSNGYYYRNNSSAKNYFYTNNAKNSTSFDSSALVRGDLISSPVHELPPADIVRETARFFEIHNSNSSGGISNWRKVVGQALRLSSDKNITETDTIANETVKHSSNSSTPIINLPDIPDTTAAITSSALMSDKSNNNTGKGSSSITSSYSSPQVPITTSSKNITTKQIGVIRPTINGSKLENNINSTLPNNCATKTSASPGLSPIVLNSSLAKGKPPLSPKPTNLFYTSSPKTSMVDNNIPKHGPSENINTTDKTEVIKAPKPGPRTLTNKNKSPEPVLAMQNNNSNYRTNSSGLHQSNQNGNDVTPLPLQDKHVSASVRKEESEAKSHFASVSLKPVPLVLTPSLLTSGLLGGPINKSSHSNSNAILERENKEPVVIENGNVNANSNSKPAINMPASKISVTTDSNANGTSPSPRLSPVVEPLPFQQVKSQLKRQPNLNSTTSSLKREEILNSNNSNANTINSSNVKPNDASNNSNLDKTKTTIAPKIKAKEAEVEKKKIKINEQNSVANLARDVVSPSLTPTTISSSLPLTSSSAPGTTATPTPLPQSTTTRSVSVPIPLPITTKPKQNARGGAGSDGTMVFNFTKTRSKVPDYIEDDGLARGFNDGDDVDSTENPDWVDPKLIQFIGANVIINGKSSIQKKPKSNKLSISFHEGPTTFEYPSETSILNEDNDGSNSESNNASLGNSNTSSTSSILGQKTPNGIHGSIGGLGNYMPSKGSTSLYQLGSYKEKLVEINDERKTEGSGNEPIQTEDYLKPDTETTMWSNEIGAADILF